MFNPNRDNYRCHVRSLPPRPVWVRVWAGIEEALMWGGLFMGLLLIGIIEVARCVVRPVLMAVTWVAREVFGLGRNLDDDN